MERNSSSADGFMFSGRLNGNPFSPCISEAEPFVRLVNSPPNTDEYGEIHGMSYDIKDRVFINHRQYYELMSDIVRCARAHIPNFRIAFLCMSEPAPVPITKDLLAEDVFISRGNLTASRNAATDCGAYISIIDTIPPQRGGGNNAISIMGSGQLTIDQFTTFLGSTLIFGSLADQRLAAI